MLEPIAIAQRFHDCVNARDLEGLRALMTEDHTLIDAAGTRLQGRAACRDAWRLFFDSFSDYRNRVDAVRITDEVVAMLGHSSCSDARLHGPAIWTARIRGSRVCEWRVYADSPQCRREFGLPHAAGSQ